MRKLRTIFMGTPDFAVPCLARLTEISEVVGVVTQPDKPRGRGQRMSPSPVKAFAETHGLTVYQPKRVREDAFISELEIIAPELIVVVAFGQILPQRILDIPPLGCVNVHASLLPRYRGAAPMQRCLMAGEMKTGVTTMFMDAGLDTGDILLSEEVAVDSDMTMEKLHNTLRDIGATLLEKTIAALLNGTVTRTKQDDAEACYAEMIKKETGKIDWKKSAVELHNLVRALDSWPGAYATLGWKTYKIWRTRVFSKASDGVPGEVIGYTETGFIVATGSGTLEILEIQAPGKKRIKAAEYLRGNILPEHSIFS